MSKSKKVRRGNLLEMLETRRLLASSYTATFEPLNNSGVSGTAQLTLDGDQLTVTINARGLEPNQIHPQHIHGLADSGTSDTESRIPSLLEDADRDGVIEHLEASVATGPAILPLSSPPASASWSMAFRRARPSSRGSDWPIRGA